MIDVHDQLVGVSIDLRMIENCKVIVCLCCFFLDELNIGLRALENNRAVNSAVTIYLKQ